MSASIDFPIPTPVPRHHPPRSAPVPPPLPPAPAIPLVPQLGGRAAFFASGARVRAAVRAGLPRHVEPRTADDPVRRTGQFLPVVDRVLREDRR
ncbi:SAV_6107 family HEPN domain-containing protein [Umezawaea beigongshangensis]|uniref:SAV_6107 family HEPN domain-containing protein n=1 Tax=Umezawaea beigongshangensis TaxID=2780383 RepID=UPI0018F13B9B|nr:SAV_6107 family HEPN domain-containing protein [Umezawaea beigongshangensis]